MTAACQLVQERQARASTSWRRRQPIGLQDAGYATPSSHALGTPRGGHVVDVEDGAGEKKKISARLFLDVCVVLALFG